ncbi:MAG: hypothetical protein EOO46_23000 [Flavobacterium sp.]|nr:MAG: hypothetical protein EOO46_23000 [Flavobacterium sp.]
MRKDIDLRIYRIKEKFLSLQNREDLVELINIILPLYFGKFGQKKITIKEFDYYASSYTTIGKKRNRYTTFFTKKKSGGLRQIMAPRNNLKYIQPNDTM